MDLRSGEQYDEWHLDGAINLPFESLRYQTASLAPERHYVVYSNAGARAMAGAFLLTERGFDVSVLNGSPQGGAPVAAVAKAGLRQPRWRPRPRRRPNARRRMRPCRNASRTPRRAVASWKTSCESMRDQQDNVAAERAQHLAQVREAVDQARRKLVETENQKREALAAQQQAYSEMEALTGNLEKLQSERSSLLGRMSEIEGLDKQLQDRLAKAERELIGERERAESATHKFDELSNKLNEEIERREEERDQHARERGQLKEQLTELQMELELANSDLEEVRGNLAKQQAEADSGEATLAEWRQQVESRDKAAEALANERDGLNEQLQQLNTAREQVEAQLSERDQQRDALQQELDGLQARLETQRSECGSTAGGKHTAGLATGTRHAARGIWSARATTEQGAGAAPAGC